MGFKSPNAEGLIEKLMLGYTKGTDWYKVVIIKKLILGFIKGNICYPAVFNI